MPDPGYAYPGGELAVFAEAANWRAYWGRQVRPFLGRRVLEVGAGIGSVTRDLCPADVELWLALEPDPAMAARLEERLRAGELPRGCRIRAGTVEDLPAAAQFDTILYADVLEHVSDDAAELRRASARLAPGGHLVVLAPAHRALYSAFDRAIGHHRRYDVASLTALTPPGTSLVRARYLDCAGLLASAANRVVLRSAAPTRSQIRVWDRWLVPASRAMDPLLGFRAGKSVLVVWRARAPGRPAGATGGTRKERPGGREGVGSSG